MAEVQQASFPEGFIQNMAERLGDELPVFLRALAEAPTRGIRLNPLKMAGSLPEGLLAPIPWEPTGQYLAAESRAGAVPLHEAGAWYLQDPAAMLPAAVLDPQPGELVLDLCAAPGGKSTQIAARQRGEGLLVCNEPVPKRAAVLARNLERMGITNALVVCAYPQTLAARWPGGFDAVMVDAPCSGEGMFRRHPETRAEWRPESPAGCASRQAEILDAAAKLVRPGGRLVYATCTLERIENEDQVEAFLQTHSDFSLRPFALPGIDAPEGWFTCWPHRTRGEGQFAALLVRDGHGEASLRASADALPRPDRASLTAYRAFAGADAPAPTALFGSTLIRAPLLPDVRGLKLLRCGLHLGEVRGARFEPDHAWAMAVPPPSFPRVALTEAEAVRYDAGEALPVAEDVHGWCLPALAGLPLGWGKASGGLLKNHYPKGLRR